MASVAVLQGGRRVAHTCAAAAVPISFAHANAAYQRRHASSVNNCVGWLLTADLPENTASLRLVPGWRDMSEISPASSHPSALKLHADEENQHITLHTESASLSLIEVNTPQMMDVQLNTPNSPVTIAGKLEGDVIADCSSLDAMSTVRGSKLDIEAGSGQVTARKVLEAQDLHVSCGHFRAKKIMAQKAVVMTGRARAVAETANSARAEQEPLAAYGVHVESSYASHAEYHAEGIGADVSVGGHHGQLTVVSLAGGISVSGLTGGVHAQAPQGSVSVQYDSARGSSSITARGDVTLSLVPPIHVRMDLRAAGSVVLKPGLTGVFRTDEKRNAQMSSEGKFVVQGTLVVTASAPDFSSHPDNLPPTPTDKKEGAGAVDAAKVGGQPLSLSGHTPHAGPAGLAMGRSSGGSGKVRDDISITGFYAEDRARSGSSAQAPVQAEGKEEPTQEQESSLPTISVHTEEGGILIEAVSWMELVKRRMQ